MLSFERTLKQKLAQKSNGNTNEEAVLMKSFKYFDLNNNGTVEPDEFAKAVEKIGIMIPTRQVSAFESLISYRISMFVSCEHDCKRLVSSINFYFLYSLGFGLSLQPLR